MNWRRAWLTLGVLGLVGMSLGLFVAAAAATNTSKAGSNPEAGLSDQQRQAIHAAAHARNAKYLDEFVSSGRDPRSLPVIQVGSFGPAPPATLGAAVSSSDLVVRARVRKVTFANSPSGGMPLATATIDVIRTVKGPTAAVVQVRQLGGPVWQADGGALAQLDTDPLLLPGDEAILMLKMGDSSGYRPLPGVGINLVKNGLVQAGSFNPFGPVVNAHTADEVMQSLAAYPQSAAK